MLCGFFASVSLQIPLGVTTLDLTWTNTSVTTSNLGAVPAAFGLRRMQGRFIDRLDFVSAYLSCMDVVQDLSQHPPLYHLYEFNNANLPSRGIAKTFIGFKNMDTGSNLLVKNIIWALAKVALLNPLLPENLRSMGLYLVWRNVDFAEMIINVQRPGWTRLPSNHTAEPTESAFGTLTERSELRTGSDVEGSVPKSALLGRQILPVTERISFSIAYGRGLLQGHNVLAGLLLGMTEIASRNDLNAREHGVAFNMFGCRFEFANEQHAGGQDISFYHTNRQAVGLIRDLSVQLTRRSEGYKEFIALMMFQGRQRGTVRVSKY